MRASNPSAFPQALNDDTGFVGCEGMSLRDYFAGQALAGILAKGGSTADVAFVGFASHAYAMADAMLHVRETERQRDFRETP